MSDKLKIDAPIGYIGDRVFVLNYKKRPAEWEEGEIREVTFTPEQQQPAFDGSKFTVKAQWRYIVWVDRPTIHDQCGRRRGGGYHLTVNGAGIRAL